MNVTKSINYTNITYVVYITNNHQNDNSMEHRTLVIPCKLSVAAALREIKKKEVNVFIPKTVKLEYTKVTYTMPLDTFVQYARAAGTVYPDRTFVKGIQSESTETSQGQARE